MSTETLGRFVGLQNLRIAKDLEMLSIVAFQQRQHHRSHGMLSEIRRSISNAQAAVGIAIIGVKLDELLQRLCVLPVPAAMFFGDGLGVVCRVIVQREEKITVGKVEVGFERNGLATSRDRLIELSLF